MPSCRPPLRVACSCAPSCQPRVFCSGDPSALILLLQYLTSKLILMETQEPEVSPLVDTQQHKSTSEGYGDMDRKLIPAFEREKGTKLLQQNLYDEAIKCFSKAIMAFEFLIKDNQLNREQMAGLLKQTVIPCYSNITLCYLKKEQFENVATFASRVIENDRNNVKAHYRRGVAYKKLKKFDKSREDLERAKLLDSSLNDAVNNILREIVTLEKAEKDKERKFAKRLLEGFGQAIDEEEKLAPKKRVNRSLMHKIKDSVKSCWRSLKRMVFPGGEVKTE